MPAKGVPIKPGFPRRKFAFVMRGASSMIGHHRLALTHHRTRNTRGDITRALPGCWHLEL